MSWSESDLAAISAAIAKGRRRVRFKDGEIEYASLEEMLRVKRLIERELGIAVRRKRISPSFSKGLDDDC